MVEKPNQEDKDAPGNERKVTSWSVFKESLFNTPTLIVTMLYVYIAAIGIVYSWALYRMFGINIFDYSEIADFLLAAFKNAFALLSIVLIAAIGATVESFMANRARRNVELVQRYLEDHKKKLDQLESEESNTTDKQREAELKQISRIQDEILKDFEEERARSFLHRLFGLPPRPMLISQGRRRGIVTIIISFIILFSSLLLPYYSAGRTASSIKEGKTPEVDVRYRSFSGSAGQVTEPGL